MSGLHCAAGDIRGALDRFYADVLAFEAALGRRWLRKVAGAEEHAVA